MWTCRFLGGVPFDTVRHGDGVREHAPHRVDGVRDAAMAREQTHVESVAATTWGPDAVDAAERPRERAPPGTLWRGRGRRGLGPRWARGGWARPVGPRRRLARLESAAEPTAKSTADPKLTGTPSTRNGESGQERKTQKKTT